MKAARQGRKKVVDVLQRSGVDMTGRDDMGNTALLWSIRNGWKERVNTLLRTQVGL